MSEDPAARLSAALEGQYSIERKLGEGGMATVYLAEDVKHQRKVALKVLKPELAAVIGGERFVTEIRTTANLQHPHILALFDSGEADGFLYYVMPFIEGETLRDRIDRERQLPVDEAIKIASSVADALDYAHRHDVIHRDIKPENILLHEGNPVVADFGIALALSAAGGGRMTETGLSLGTPHYMSPEQATADRDLSSRSDVYSLACVLYEMLAGDPPHTGPTAQAILMRILTEDPRPVTDVRKSVPPHIASVLSKALQKLPADRFESADDFRKALDDRGFQYTAAHRVPTTEVITAVPAAVTARRRSALQRLLPWGTAALLGATALWGWLRPEPVARHDLALGVIQPRLQDDVVISPDGTMLAVSGVVDGETAIYLRRIGEPDFRKVPETENGQYPSFSPDGEWLVFRDATEGALIKVAIAGGGALTLYTGRGRIRDPYWGEEGTILFVAAAGGGGLRSVQETGGEAPQLRGGMNGRHPQLLPDGRGVLTVVDGAVHVYDPALDSSWAVVPEGLHPTYVKTGHILYVPPSGGLFAVPFDLARREVTGSPSRLLDRVASTDTRSGYSVSRDGTLVYLEGDVDVLGGVSGGPPPTRFLIRDFAGQVDSIRPPAGRKTNPRFSPDGRSIAYEIFRAGGGGQTDIHTFDLVTGTDTRITFTGDNDDPLWSPDGTRILFNSDRGPETTEDEDLFVKPADNSSAAASILTRPRDQVPLAWLDGDVLVFQSEEETSGSDLYTYPLPGGAEPEPYLQAPWSEFDFALHPDGSLAALVSTETETVEVWLRDYPEPEGKWQVSFGGGRFPRWSPDGGTLYYWRFTSGPDTLFSVKVDTDPSVVVRNREVVLAVDIFTDWDLHPDGDRFIVTEVVGTTPASIAAPAPGGAPAAASSGRYLIVLNWFEELKERVGN